MNEYLDREVFEMRSKEDTGKANQLVEMAGSLGVSECNLEGLTKAFSKGYLQLSGLNSQSQKERELA